MYSSYSHWSGALKSSSAMAKMTIEPIHRRSCANNSALVVDLVWNWLDIPYSSSESLASGAPAPETTAEQPSEPPKIDLFDGVDEARDRTPPNPPSTPPLLRCGDRAAEQHYRGA